MATWSWRLCPTSQLITSHRLEGGGGFVGILEEIDVGGWRCEAVGDGGCRGAGGGSVHLGLVGGFAAQEVLLALILEACILANEVQVDGVGGTATMFGDDKFGQSADVVSLGILAGARVVLGTVDEAHDVGILLDGTRLTQVAQLGPLAHLVVGRTGLDTTVELREGDDGDIQFLGQLLEVT